MSAPSTIIHGLRHFALTAPEEKPGRKGLDAVRQRWQAGRKDAFQQDEEGRISRFPGYSSVFIDDLTCIEEIPGHAYEFDLKGLGLLTGRDKWIAGPRSQPEQGWDTASFTVYTRRPDLLKNGLVHPELGSMWVTDNEKQREIGDVHKVDLSYKGIIPVDGLPKPYKRQIGVNSATISSGEPMRVLVKQLDGSYVLTGAPGNYFNFESPRVQVTDSYLSLTAPPTDSIPGTWEPPDAPAVRTHLTSTVYGDPIVIPDILGDTEYSLNVPYGWVLKSISGDKLAGVNVWLIQLSVEYIRPRDTRI